MGQLAALELAVGQRLVAALQRPSAPVRLELGLALLVDLEPQHFVVPFAPLQLLFSALLAWRPKQLAVQLLVAAPQLVVAALELAQGLVRQLA